MVKYYAVRKGRTTGIFTDWPTTEASVKGFTGAIYKSFPTYEAAEEFLNVDTAPPPPAPVPAAAPATVSGSGRTIRTITVPIPIKEHKTVELPVDPFSTRIAYTDGSCDSGVGGYGWIVLEGCEILQEASGRVPYDPCTNQKAELYAILSVLKNNQDPSLVIRTDSAYSIGCLSQWCDNWRRNGWKTADGSPVLNASLIKEILAAMQGRSIRFEKVAGHSGERHNEYVDKLAKAGRYE